MMATLRILCVATLAIVAQGCGSDEQVAAFRPLDVGAPVPMYAARTLGGDTVTVGGANAPTVLNVWATWCTSCQEEMAALDSIKREFESRGVRVIAVSVDDGSAERVRRFAETNRLQFTVAHDPAATIERSYQVVGVPTTFVVDGNGRLAWRHTGNIVDLIDELRNAVGKTIER